MPPVIVLFTNKTMAMMATTAKMPASAIDLSIVLPRRNGPGLAVLVFFRARASVRHCVRAHGRFGNIAADRRRALSACARQGLFCTTDKADVAATGLDISACKRIDTERPRGLRPLQHDLACDSSANNHDCRKDHNKNADDADNGPEDSIVWHLFFLHVLSAAKRLFKPFVEVSVVGVNRMSNEKVPGQHLDEAVMDVVAAKVCHDLVRQFTK